MSVVVSEPDDGCPECGGAVDLVSNSPTGGPDRNRWFACRDCPWEGDAA